VEGGRQLLQSFIDEGLWDEIRVEYGTDYLYEGVPAPMIKPSKTLKETLKWGRKYHIIYNFV